MSPSPNFSPDIWAAIHKRMTMNMLVQGAACHSQLTAHHLVQEELDALGPPVTDAVPEMNGKQLKSNTQFYDLLSAGLLMSQWNSEIAFITGFSGRFWNRASAGKSILGHHPLLMQHGKLLSERSRSKTLKRCESKGIRGVPFDLTFDLAELIVPLVDFENANRKRLEELAVDIAIRIWGIDRELLDASLTDAPEFGGIRTPRTARGRILRKAMVGWSGVRQRDDGELIVVAKSKYWILLLHELSKGTVELISLHGLNQLQDDVYDIVMEEADQIEFEVWMMQSGLELYRLFLNSVPRSLSIPRAMMHVARMPCELHERYSFALVDDMETATAILREAAGD